jgi:hypothetical protein
MPDRASDRAAGSCQTAPASRPIALPGVHRVASLLKRWRTDPLHDGCSIDQLDDDLDDDLDEFASRVKRRTARSRGLLFYRLLQQAVATDPTPTGNARPRPASTATPGRDARHSAAPSRARGTDNLGDEFVPPIGLSSGGLRLVGFARSGNWPGPTVEVPVGKLIISTHITVDGVIGPSPTDWAILEGEGERYKFD